MKTTVTEKKKNLSIMFEKEKRFSMSLQKKVRHILFQIKFSDFSLFFTDEQKELLKYDRLAMIE